MKQTDLEARIAHFVKFIAANCLTQEDALAVAEAVLNDRGKELLKANAEFGELDDLQPLLVRQDQVRW